MMHPYAVPLTCCLPHALSPAFLSFPLIIRVYFGKEKKINNKRDLNKENDSAVSEISLKEHLTLQPW
jgi:hypothetical protein